MNLSRHSLTRFASIVILSAATALASAADEMSAEDFVEKASAAGIAEVQTANLALEKAQSAEVKAFAKKMISDHTNANEELKRIAQKKNINLADEAEMMDMAKARALETREGESFDEAYANSQVDAHVETVELFRNAAANVKDQDLNTFAKTKLPALEQHLKMAKELAKKHKN